MPLLSALAMATTAQEKHRERQNALKQDVTPWTRRRFRVVPRPRRCWDGFISGKFL